VQQAWIEAYKNPEWIKREILKAVAWYENKNRPIKNAGKAFGNWMANSQVPTFEQGANEQRVKCIACSSGLIRAINRSSGVSEWTACSCELGRNKSSYIRFDENRFERTG
jgi:hypothetical protein